jgi:hypothetical protein
MAPGLLSSSVIRCAIAVCIVAHVTAALAARRTVDQGSEPNYWATHSVVYAKVVGWRTTIDTAGTLVLQPHATLSGAFDAAANPEIVVKANAIVSPGFESDPVPVPKPGQMVLFVLDGPPSDRVSGMPIQLYRVGWAALYMPDDCSPVSHVEGSSDRRVQRTLTSIQDVRRGAPFESATSREYWRNHSVILAQVWFTYAKRRHYMVVFPLGTISGDFDAGAPPGLSEPGKPPPAEPVSSELDPMAWTGLAVEWNQAMRGEILDPSPKARDKILLVLRKDEATGQYVSVETLSAFMPGEHYSSRIVKGFADPDVTATLEAIQQLRRRAASGKVTKAQ